MLQGGQDHEAMPLSDAPSEFLLLPRLSSHESQGRLKGDVVNIYAVWVKCGPCIIAFGGDFYRLDYISLYREAYTTRWGSLGKKANINTNHRFKRVITKSFYHYYIRVRW